MKSGMNGNNKQRKSASLEVLAAALKPFSSEKLLDCMLRIAARQTYFGDMIVDYVLEDIVTRKLFLRFFVGTPSIESIRACFEEFGELEDASIIFDHVSHRPKGFGFVFFRQATAATFALSTPLKTIDGVVCEVSYVQPGKELDHILGGGSTNTPNGGSYMHANSLLGLGNNIYSPTSMQQLPAQGFPMMQQLMQNTRIQQQAQQQVQQQQFAVRNAMNTIGGTSALGVSQQSPMSAVQGFDPSALGMLSQQQQFQLQQIFQQLSVGTASGGSIGSIENGNNVNGVTIPSSPESSHQSPNNQEQLQTATQQRQRQLEADQQAQMRQWTQGQLQPIPPPAAVLPQTYLPSGYQQQTPYQMANAYQSSNPPLLQQQQMMAALAQVQQQQYLPQAPIFGASPYGSHQPHVHRASSTDSDASTSTGAQFSLKSYNSIGGLSSSGPSPVGSNSIYPPLHQPTMSFLQQQLMQQQQNQAFMQMQPQPSSNQWFSAQDVKTSMPSTSSAFSMTTGVMGTTDQHNDSMFSQMSPQMLEALVSSMAAQGILQPGATGYTQAPILDTQTSGTHTPAKTNSSGTHTPLSASAFVFASTQSPRSKHNSNTIEASLLPLTNAGTSALVGESDVIATGASLGISKHR